MPKITSKANKDKIMTGFLYAAGAALFTLASGYVVAWWRSRNA